MRDLHRYTIVNVLGHADARPTPIGNDVLSRQRAEEVVAHLVAAGLPASMLHAEGRGDREPLDPRPVPEAWDLNRRIEIVAICA